MSTLTDLIDARRAVEEANAALTRASFNLHEANVNLMRAMAPILAIVTRAQPITSRPPRGELVDRITIGRRFIRCHYASDGGRPIRIPVYTLDRPIDEVILKIESEHARRKKVEADRVADGLKQMSDAFFKFTEKTRHELAGVALRKP